jgi:polyhydroxyalkanoate synthesis regulator phasin
MTERTVKVKVDGMQGGKLTAAGGSVGDNVQPGSVISDHGGNVDIDAKNVNGEMVVAGGDVLKFANQVAAPLDELVELLKTNLAQQDQIAYLQEVVNDLKSQASKSIEERNVSKMQMLLDNLGKFLGLATLAATQADKAHNLFEMAKRLLMP